MIGYVKIYKPELKMKDFQVYNAYYCGICKSLGKKYGIIYRNLLNYDSVFLALALDSINGHVSDYENFRCILHPVKKKIRCINSSSLEYVTDITVYMTYMKLLDDIDDDNSLSAKIASGAFRSAYKTAKSALGPLGNKIKTLLKKLGKLEKENSDSIDETADCYGEIYSLIFTELLEEDIAEYKAAKWMGYNIGRWIYIIDAYDDIEADIKKNRYNPVIKRFPKNANMDIEGYKKSIRDRMAFIIYSALDEASKAYDLIDKSVNSGIIRNILYEGLYSVTEKVMNGDCLNGTKESI